MNNNVKYTRDEKGAVIKVDVLTALGVYTFKPLYNKYGVLEGYNTQTPENEPEGFSRTLCILENDFLGKVYFYLSFEKDTQDEDRPLRKWIYLGVVADTTALPGEISFEFERVQPGRWTKEDLMTKLIPGVNSFVTLEEANIVVEQLEHPVS